jgi:hypothetical protein
MFSIVSDVIQKDVQQFDIPMPCSISNSAQNTFKIPGPSYGLVDVSDSDDDSDDDTDDGEDENKNETEEENTQPIFTLSDNVCEDGINIQLLDITDITGVTEASDVAKVTDVISTNNNINEITLDMNSDDKKSAYEGLPSEVIEDAVTDELNITVIHSETKHNGGSSTTHHKSLHVNELRKMAVQLQLIQNVEAKKLKKDDLIDLISKSTEAKQE